MTPKKAFFVMLGVLTLVMILTSAGIYFGDSYLVRRSEAISDLRADDEILNTAILSAQTTRDELQQYGYIDLIAAEVLPGVKNQSEILLIIDKIGQQVGVNVDRYSFVSTSGNPGDLTQTEPLKGVPGILVFPINVTFDATYSQLIQWLKLAEENQRKMQIESIVIAPAGGNNSGNVFGVNMVINAFVEN